jgi:hypothetical protein
VKFWVDLDPTNDLYSDLGFFPCLGHSGTYFSIVQGCMLAGYHLACVDEDYGGSG